MSTAPHVAATILSWGGIALLAIGLVLLKMGWFPRRRGFEPRCRRCGYEVTGNVSGRCPECGADLAGRRAIVNGTRRRRWVPTMAGVAAVLLGVVCFTPQTRRSLASVDWYKLRPASWVIGDLRGPVATDQLRALVELERRRADGSLSDAHRQQLIETMLAMQAAGPSPAEDAVLAYLAARDADGALTNAQRDQFFRQMFQLTLRTRPRVAGGGHLPWHLAYDIRAPRNNWWRKSEFASLAIDGQDLPPEYASGSSSSSHVRGPGTHGSWLRAPKEPGQHTLRAVARFTIAEGTMDAPGRTVFTGDFPVQTTFDVLPPGELEPIAEVDDPAMGERLRGAIRVRGLAPETYGVGALRGMIDLNERPTNVAFDVIVRANGREYPNGTIAWPKATGGASTGIHGKEKIDPLPDTVDVILRSSPAAARNTVELSEIWKGELVFEKIPVTRPASRPSPAGSPTGTDADQD